MPWFTTAAPMPRVDGAGGARRRTAHPGDGRAGGQPDGRHGPAALSRDGRFVVFVSDATNLVAGDTNDSTDVFVRDLSA